MKALKIGCVVVIALVVVCMGIGLFLPREWNAERSVVIQAPPEKIHAWVEAPARWREWVAAESLRSDPSYQVTTSGPERGVGATFAWESSGSRGRMVIVASDPATGIRIDEAIESDDVNAHGTIAYAPEAGGTRVTWTDRGTLPPVVGGFLTGVFDAAIGKSFEKSLALLKAKVEAEK